MPSRATLAARWSRYAKILFDGRGDALYVFARDRGGRSTCNGACARNVSNFGGLWLIVAPTGKAVR
jgi:predicted lipoprotein with Yx(FWY)xxD motif